MEDNTVKTKTYGTVSTLLALMLMLVSASCITATTPPLEKAVPVLMEAPPPEDMLYVSDIDITKLQISPRHTGIELMPGESDEITVTVKNTNNETVSVNPMVVDQPYSEYIFEAEWINITPGSAELEADAEVEFTISVAIPDDAERGQYNTQIAFTDDLMPTPYPPPYPMYINALDLYISVWKLPVMQIQPRYIHDRVGSGKAYDYTINLKNTGVEDIEIDPELKPERWYYEMGGQAFEDDAITITAPKVVHANETATVNVHLEVPLGANGEYYSGLDLGIDDSSSGGWYGESEMVQLNFVVWTQPTEPYTKEFTTETAAPITIEIESNQYRYDMCGGGSSGSGDDEKPSFDVVLKGPSTGDPVTLTRTVVEHHGSVHLGSSDCTPPWETDSSGMYNEGHTSYVERYTANGQIGNWELGILPHYVEEFEYTIEIGDSET